MTAKIKGNKDVLDNSNLLINAIGYLHDENFLPEKKVSEINSNYLLKSFQNY